MAEPLAPHVKIATIAARGGAHAREKVQSSHPGLADPHAAERTDRDIGRNRRAGPVVDR